MQKINDYIIELNNAYVVYNHKQPNEFVGLKNFNFKFEKQKIYCIIGKSGSGKSTLISLFNGLNRVNYGDVKLAGIALNSARNLNHAILGYFHFSNLDLIKDITNNSKITNKEDNFYLIKTAKDLKQYDLTSALLTINNNEKYECYKINKIMQQKLNLSSNNLNKFYLIKINNDNLKNCEKLIKDFEQFKTNDDSRIKIKNVKCTKRIKQYKKLRKEVGMVSQFPEFQLFKYTVIDDVSFGLRALGTNKQEALSLAKKQLLKLGIKESHFNNSPFALSGGQKRRVAIAGILAIDSSTLIFDEPTAGLDPIGEKEMIDIILNAKNENKNIFVVTHSMDQVLEIADEILVIHEGELIAHGCPYEIFNNDKVLKHTNIEQPYVIKTINELIKKNNKFNRLNELKPRTIDSLAECLVKIRDGK